MFDPFPDDFLWGAALTGHQIEGGNFASDWWRWEQRPGRIVNKTTSKTAANHWNRHADDLKLAAELGLNTVSIVVEWSRVEPEPGTYDEAALEHYVEVVKTARERNLEPIVILHHVTQPEWFARKSGWLQNDAPDKFAAYTDKVVATLVNHVQWWIPIADPVHYATRTFHEQRWPATKSGVFSGKRALRHIAQAHTRARNAIRARRDDALVGTSTRLRNVHPQNPHSAWDARAALRHMRRANRDYLNATARDSDFIAASYMGREFAQFHWNRPGAGFSTTTDAGGNPAGDLTFENDAQSLTPLLDQLLTYDRPILITGNGAVGGDNPDQCGALLDHTAVIRHALERGVPIKGYIYRALLDGFEWTEGLAHHAALVHVDFDRLTRTPNTIAYLYKELCETGAVRPGTVAQFCPDWTSPIQETQP